MQQALEEERERLQQEKDRLVALKLELEREKDAMQKQQQQKRQQERLQQQQQQLQQQHQALLMAGYDPQSAAAMIYYQQQQQQQQQQQLQFQQQQQQQSQFQQQSRAGYASSVVSTSAIARPVNGYMASSVVAAPGSQLAQEQRPQSPTPSESASATGPSVVLLGPSYPSMAPAVLGFSQAPPPPLMSAQPPFWMMPPPHAMLPRLDEEMPGVSTEEDAEEDAGADEELDRNGDPKTGGLIDQVAKARRNRSTAYNPRLGYSHPNTTTATSSSLNTHALNKPPPSSQAFTNPRRNNANNNRRRQTMFGDARTVVSAATGPARSVAGMTTASFNTFQYAPAPPQMFHYPQFAGVYPPQPPVASMASFPHMPFTMQPMVQQQPTMFGPPFQPNAVNSQSLFPKNPSSSNGDDDEEEDCLPIAVVRLKPSNNQKQ
jgi:hypothetical protein